MHLVHHRRSGTDGSPRGDEAPVATVLDAGTVALPDWKGNERIDSLRNIVADGQVSQYFLIPGSTTSVRINGSAKLTADATLRARLAKDGRQPRTVIVITLAEIYSLYACALQRSALWTSGDQSANLPTVGQMMQGGCRRGPLLYQTRHPRTFGHVAI